MSRTHLVGCLAALSVLAAAAAALPPYLPTHDGPQHIFGVHAANHLDDVASGWGEWLRPNFPPTNHGFTAVFGPLDLWLPWRTALRIALALLALGWVLACFAFARAVHPERGWLGLLLGAAAFQWALYMGFFSFYLATALGLVVLAVAFGRPRWDWRVRALLAVLLLFEALMHIVPALLTGGLLALLALLRAPAGGRLAELARVAAVGAPAALVAVRLAWVGLGTMGDYNKGVGEVGQTPLPEWWTLGKCFVGGPAWRAWPLALLALASPGIALAGGWRRLRVEDRALLLGGSVLLLAGLALPLHIRAWDYFSVRFLPMATCTLVAALPLERLARGLPRNALAGAAAAFGLAATGWALSYNLALYERSEEALAGLDAELSRSGPRLPIVFEPLAGRAVENERARIPYAVPLGNLGELYATAHGGITPYGFTVNPHLHPVVERKEMIARLPASPERGFAADLGLEGNRGNLRLRQAIASDAASYGTRYEEVIVWGRPEDADFVASLGYEPSFRRGGLLLARFVGCPLEIRITPPSAVADDTVLELGWFPSGRAQHRYTLGRASREADAVRLPVRQSCGDIWLRFADGERVCDGADATGRLLVTSVRGAPQVECRVRPSEQVASRP